MTTNLDDAIALLLRHEASKGGATADVVTRATAAVVTLAIGNRFSAHKIDGLMRQVRAVADKVFA